METRFGGYMGKILEIDLTDETTNEYPWSDHEREKYLGGRIMAMKILRDYLSENDSPVIISTGPLTGTGAPASERYELTAISPRDGKITSTNCGGSFGVFLKRAGYDALVIKGKASAPRWLEIDGDNILFHDAHKLWGMRAGECRSKLAQLIGKEKFGKLCIGPAGENLVKFASVVGDEHASGRGGIGAVLGWKNLKAITVWGEKEMPICRTAETKALIKEWFNHLHTHPITGGGQKNGCTGCPINCGKTEKTFKLPGAELSAEEECNIARELDEMGLDAVSTANALAGLKSAAEVIEAINALDFPEIPTNRGGGHHRRNSGFKALVEHFGIEDEESFGKLYRALGEAVSASGLCLFTVNGLVFDENSPRLHHADMLAALGLDMDMEKFIRIGESQAK